MRNLLIFTMLFCFIGSMAMASQTRVLTMGEVNGIVKDDANIWIFPQTISEYPNLFTAEFDGDYFWQAGANFGFGEDEKAWVLGAYFSQEDFDHYYFDLDNSDEDHRINLFYGRELGGKPFGMNFGYYGGGSENADTDVANNWNESFSRYEFTFGYTPMPELELSAGFAMSTWTDEVSDGTALIDQTAPDGNSDFFLMGRYWMAPRGNCTPLIHGGFYSSKAGIEDYDGTGTLTNTDNYSETMFELGMAMNYDGGSDVLVVSDFGFTFANEKWESAPVGGTATEYKESNIALPFFKIGIDAKVFEWMDFRAGVTNHWVGWKGEQTDEEETWSGAETNTYLGAGFHWGNFEIDARIDENFIEDGPYFISGDDTNNMFEMVTINYFFN